MKTDNEKLENLKKKRHWLIGGIIGAVFTILLINLVDIRDVDILAYIYIPAVAYILSGPGMIIGTRSVAKGFIAFFINGFIYGAILGWLYSKIKNRKNNVAPKA